MNKDPHARIRFAIAMLKLAKKELKEHGNQFMLPGEDVYDSAVQYGGKLKPKLTRKELQEVEKKYNIL